MSDTHTRESTSGLVHIKQDKREIPAIVNEKISDLVHDFMNFNALKIILKIHKKIKTDLGLMLTQGNLFVV